MAEGAVCLNSNSSNAGEKRWRHSRSSDTGFAVLSGFQGGGEAVAAKAPSRARAGPAYAPSAAQLMSPERGRRGAVQSEGVVRDERWKLFPAGASLSLWLKAPSRARASRRRQRNTAREKPDVTTRRSPVKLAARETLPTRG